jgi:hypothetical protein
MEDWRLIHAPRKRSALHFDWMPACRWAIYNNITRRKWRMKERWPKLYSELRNIRLNLELDVIALLLFITRNFKEYYRDRTKRNILLIVGRTVYFAF